MSRYDRQDVRFPSGVNDSADLTLFSDSRASVMLGLIAQEPGVGGIAFWKRQLEQTSGLFPVGPVAGVFQYMADDPANDTYILLINGVWCKTSITANAGTYSLDGLNVTNTPPVNVSDQSGVTFSPFRRVRAAQIGSELIFVQDGGVRPVRYNGTTIYKLGIDVPPAPTDGGNLSSGGLNAGDTYQWKVTYGDVYGRESVISSALSVVVAGNGELINITPSTSPVVTKIYLYRTVGNGSTFYRVVESGLPPSTTSYSDMVDDTTLAANSQPASLSTPGSLTDGGDKATGPLVSGDNYTWGVTYADALGRESPMSTRVTVKATATGARTITWAIPTDPLVVKVYLYRSVPPDIPPARLYRVEENGYAPWQQAWLDALTTDGAIAGNTANFIVGGVVPTDGGNLAGGSLTTGAAYQYAVTYADAKGRETGLTGGGTGYLTVTMGAGGGRIINWAAPVDPSITKIYLYRTTANGSSFYRVDASGFSIATLTYNDNTVDDATLLTHVALSTLSAPSTPSDGGPTITGSLTPGMTYKYEATYADVEGRESAGSAALTVTIGASGNRQVTWPAPGAGVTQVYLYRSKAGGAGTLYRVQNGGFGPTTENTYLDTVSDSFIGSNVPMAGLPAPSTPTDGGASSSGALTPSAVYKYAIVEADEKGRMSSPSAPLSVTMGGDGGRVINWAAATDPQVQRIYLVRTVAGGAVFYRVVEAGFSATTTTYTDSTVDDTTLEFNTPAPLAGENDPPENASMVSDYKFRLALNSTENVRELKISNLNEPGSFSKLGPIYDSSGLLLNATDGTTLNVITRFGDEISAISAGPGSVLGVWTRRSFGVFEGDRPDQYQYRRLHPIGTIATDSVQPCGDITPFLAEDGLYGVDYLSGFSVVKLSDDLDNLFKSVTVKFDAPTSWPPTTYYTRDQRAVAAVSTFIQNRYVLATPPYTVIFNFDTKTFSMDYMTGMPFGDGELSNGYLSLSRVFVDRQFQVALYSPGVGASSETGNLYVMSYYPLWNDPNLFQTNQFVYQTRALDGRGVARERLKRFKRTTLYGSIEAAPDATPGAGSVAQFNGTISLVMDDGYVFGPYPFDNISQAGTQYVGADFANLAKRGILIEQEWPADAVGKACVVLIQGQMNGRMKLGDLIPEYFVLDGA